VQFPDRRARDQESPGTEPVFLEQVAQAIDNAVSYPDRRTVGTRRHLDAYRFLKETGTGHVQVSERGDVRGALIG
jgi:hypothetical protein